MSRSYRKNPIIKYGGNSKYGKKQANKTVRKHIKQNLDNVPDKSNWFKKVYCSYDINDIIDRCPKESFLAIRRGFFNEDCTDHDWAKGYYWK